MSNQTTVLTPPSSDDRIGDRLVLGTLHLRGLKRTEVFNVLNTFFGLGGRYLDVATFYGGIGFLRLIGEYLRGSRAPAQVFVKIGYFKNTQQYHNRGWISSRISLTLEAIGECAFALLMHEADWRIWWVPSALPRELCTQKDMPAIAARLHEFQKMLRSWPLRYGIAGNNAEALSLVQSQLNPASVVLVAKQYDLLWRNALPLVCKLNKPGGILILGAPWHQGWLRDLDRLVSERRELASAVKQLRNLARRADIGVDQLALPFVRQTAPSALIAFGARKPNEVLQAFTDAKRTLSTALLEELELIGAEMPPMGPLIPFFCSGTS